MNIKPGLTFDDVLLVPQHSTIESRSKIKLNVDLGKNVTLDMPIVSANMKNVTGKEMAAEIAFAGGLALLHRFNSIEDQLLMYRDACDEVYERRNSEDRPINIGCSVGVSEEDKENFYKWADVGCDIFCVDVAHGDHKLCLSMVEFIANRCPNALLIAGNAATAEGAWLLYNAGADVIKVGIGPGSLCTTRIETGNGVPQMTALENVFIKSCNDNDINNRRFKIIADGGIKRAGDCVKALCFSDAVMLGSMIAGTDEAPGEVIVDAKTGRRFKTYAGSSTHKANRVEGVIRQVPVKGPVRNILIKIYEGIQSGLSYQGCDNLLDLKDNPEFVKITNAGLAESHPHSY